VTRACFTTDRANTPCSTSSERPELLHVPRSVKGFYCSQHCPVCGREGARLQGIEDEIEQVEAQRLLSGVSKELVTRAK
jgi:hypothetical protein